MEQLILQNSIIRLSAPTEIIIDDGIGKVAIFTK